MSVKYNIRLFNADILKLAIYEFLQAKRNETIRSGIETISDKTKYFCGI